MLLLSSIPLWFPVFRLWPLCFLQVFLFPGFWVFMIMCFSESLFVVVLLIVLCTQWTLLMWRLFWFCSSFLYYFFNSLSNFSSIIFSWDSKRKVLNFLACFSKFSYLKYFISISLYFCFASREIFSTLLTTSTNFIYFHHYIFNVQELFIFFECSIL